MKLLTKEQQELYENGKICYICKEKFENKYVQNEKYQKVKDYCHDTEEYRGATHSICNLNIVCLQKVPIPFHNGFNYDYHFIIKKLPEEFEK